MSDETRVPHDPGTTGDPAPADTAARRPGVSRRAVLKGGGAAGLAAALAGATVGTAAGAAARPGRRPEIVPGAQPGDGAADLVLVNGRIHTMDGAGTVAAAASIRDARFASVGHAAPARGPGTRVINLHGRTVVPGIIDNHNHIVLMGNRPGYHTPLENAASIADIQDTINDRAAGIPDGAWITTIGGFHRNQADPFSPYRRRRQGRPRRGARPLNESAPPAPVQGARHPPLRGRRIPDRRRQREHQIQ